MGRNSRLFARSVLSPDSQRADPRARFAESLRPRPEIFPFCGDYRRRLGAMTTAPRGVQSTTAMTCDSWLHQFPVRQRVAYGQKQIVLRFVTGLSPGRSIDVRPAHKWERHPPDSPPVAAVLRPPVPRAVLRLVCRPIPKARRPALIGSSARRAPTISSSGRGNGSRRMNLRQPCARGTRAGARSLRRPLSMLHPGPDFIRHKVLAVRAANTRGLGVVEGALPA
jgi:hypothetical protein